MSHLFAEDIAQLPSRYRANLINSVTGYKSCNLLGSKSADGHTNLAIFSSVIHIGSSPPLLGFILRPLTVRRDTFTNIKDLGYFTVNQVSVEMYHRAHQTSAKYEKEVSEFDEIGFKVEYLDDFEAPYVAESTIKIGCKYVNHYPLEENDCLLVIGSIERLYFPKEIQDSDGFIRLDKAATVTSMGMDGYALPAYLERLTYARPGSEPSTLINGT
ncbi:flavin reductase [uncultured Muriicola sp.]|uniref:flavin reductase family protein n=1 Tax=uncultured Muriicola sp. TaxID=1583102 RepID=UPI0026070CC1|nr:flavin reductase [uncultured Muriicola sp.]